MAYQGNIATRLALVAAASVGDDPGFDFSGLDRLFALPDAQAAAPDSSVTPQVDHDQAITLTA